jgi:hypothetical protein
VAGKRGSRLFLGPAREQSGSAEDVADNFVLPQQKRKELPMEELPPAFQRFNLVVFEQTRLWIESFPPISLADNVPYREKGSQVDVAFVLGVAKAFEYRAVEFNEASRCKESTNAIPKQGSEGASAILALETRDSSLVIAVLDWRAFDPGIAPSLRKCGNTSH